MFDHILLEQEQNDLLISLVEAARNVPHEKRQEFRVSPVAHPAVTYTASIYHEGFGNENHPGVYRPDIETLGREGMLAISNRSSFRGYEGFSFSITPLGFQYYQYLKQKLGQPLQRIKNSVPIEREVDQIMSNMSISKSYHGFHIEGKREYPTMGDYDRCVFRVTLENKLVFRHSIHISGTYLHQLDAHQGRVDITQLLLNRGFNRVCGKIDLKAYEDGENTEYSIVEDESTTRKTLTDKEIRLQVLNMLCRLKRMLAERARLEPFNVEGFCEILSIEKSDYLWNADYLLGKGYVAASPIQQHTFEKGGIYITPNGIDYLEEGGNLRPIININTDGGDFVGRDKHIK